MLTFQREQLYFLQKEAGGGMLPADAAPDSNTGFFTHRAKTLIYKLPTELSTLSTGAKIHRTWVLS